MNTPPPPNASPRPCLPVGRSAVRRAPDAVQFGTDPRRALVLDGLTPPLRSMVTALDGTRGAGEVIADAVARGVSPAPARAVLDALADAGLLGGDVGAAPSPAPPATVLLRGRGRLAVALAGVLAGPGVDVGVVAPGCVKVTDTGTGLTLADVGRPITDAVARAFPAVRSGPPPRPDLVVLAGAATEPALADELVRHGRAHLAVALRDGVGYVGPLVLPGHGPCLRCVELARTDVDPAWPAVLAQLVGAPPATEVADAAAAAALAAAQVLAALGAGSRPGAAATLGGVLELDLHRGTLSRTEVTVHPACVCGTGRVSTPEPVHPARSGDVARVA